METFPVEVILVISAQETLPNNQQIGQFLLTEGKHPSAFLTKNKTTQCIAEELLLEYTGVESHWVSILSLGIIEEPGVVRILYAVFFHETTRIRVDKSEWVAYKSIVDNNIKHLIDEAIWRKSY